MRHHVGAGRDQDVAVGRDLAAQLQRAGGVDHHIGIAPGGDQAALDDAAAARTECDVAAAGLQHAQNAHVHVLRAAVGGAGVHVDRLVADDPVVDADLATRDARLAQVDDRALLACVHRVLARRYHLRGCGELVEAQPVRANAVGRQQAEPVEAGQQQMAIEQTHLQHGIGNGLGGVGHQDPGHRIDLAEYRRVQRVAQILCQETGTVVAAGGGLGQVHRAAQHVRAHVDLQVERHVIAQVAVGELGEAAGQDLPAPGRRQHR